MIVTHCQAKLYRATFRPDDQEVYLVATDFEDALFRINRRRQIKAAKGRRA